MARFEYETIIAPPEFEVRCDQFIEAVRDQVDEQYPHIIVRSFNKTKFQLDSHQQALWKLRNRETITPFIQENIKFHQQMIHYIDVSSASFYLAFVGLYGRGSNDRQSIKEILLAKEDVDALAFKYHGLGIYPTLPEDLDRDLITSNPPQTYLYYKFSDRQTI